MDKEGKDSWRFAQAGAKTVAFSTPDGFALMRYAPWDLSEIAKLMPGMDLVLAEGHKGRFLSEDHRPSSGSGRASRAYRAHHRHRRLLDPRSSSLLQA
ncbi:MAG: molybdopterin-guanine dinucleotide biosynthesis protein B [Limnochordia bacterium]